jgi:hypothetical protein
LQSKVEALRAMYRWHMGCFFIAGDRSSVVRHELGDIDV